MYIFIGVISAIYIAIEALAMGTTIFVDADGNVDPDYKILVALVDLSKTTYLATVEFLFISLFAVIVSRARSDGWQFRDIFPISAALAIMLMVTIIILSVYMVDRGYLTIGGPDAQYLPGYLAKNVVGRDYNTFLVIILSFFVAILRTMFERVDKDAKKSEKSEKKGESTKKPEDKKDKDEKPKDESENKDDKDKVHSLIEDDWWDNADIHTMEKIFQRATAKDRPAPSLNIRAMIDKNEDDFANAMEFISDEGETTNGISRENEIIAAKIVAESWGVLASKDTIRDNKDTAKRFRK